MRKTLPTLPLLSGGLFFLKKNYLFFAQLGLGDRTGRVVLTRLKITAPQQSPDAPPTLLRSKH